MEDFNRVEQRQEATTARGDLGGITNAESKSFFSQSQQNNKQATEGMVQSGMLPGLDLTGFQTATNSLDNGKSGGTASSAEQNSEATAPSPMGDSSQNPRAENTSPTTDRNLRNDDDQKNSENRDSVGLKPVGPSGDNPSQNKTESPRGPKGDAQSKTGTESGDSQTKTPEAPEGDEQTTPGDTKTQPQESPKDDGQSRTGSEGNDSKSNTPDAPGAPQRDGGPTPGDTKAQPPQAPGGSSQSTTGTKAGDTQTLTPPAAPEGRRTAG